MKLPNWQHHSKKEAKRTLKPQALRQAKKRRAALKAKLLASTVALVGFASPAQAVTWEEFWEPFTGDKHHHYYYPEYPHRRPSKMCKVVIKNEKWVPGYWTGRRYPEYIEGYWKTVRKVKWKPCYRF